MNLEAHLRAADDERGGDVRRAAVGGEQGNGLAGDSLGVAGQVEVSYVLPTAATLLPAHGLGVGATLYLPVADGGGLDAAAGLVDCLLHVGTLTVGKGLALADKNEVACAGGDSFDASHALVDVQQQGQLLLGRDSERVNFYRRGVDAPAGDRWPQLHLRPARRCRRLGDLHGQRSNLVHGFRRHGVGRSEPPGSVHHHTHAHPQRFVVTDDVHHPRAHRVAFLNRLHHPRVDIRRPPCRRGVQRAGNQTVHIQMLPMVGCADCGLLYARVQAERVPLRRQGVGGNIRRQGEGQVMDITISEELLKRIQWKVDAGIYPSADEVIERALDLLDEYDVEIAKIQDMVQVGMDDLAEGRYTTYTEETLDNLVEDVKRRSLERLESRKGTRIV